VISSEQAHAFTVGWFAAWNAHDIQVIHSHYEDGLTLSSPSIVNTTCEPSGRQAGKEAVGAYWKNGLFLTPELYFGIKKFLSGMDSIMMICKALLECQRRSDSRQNRTV